MYKKIKDYGIFIFSVCFIFTLLISVSTDIKVFATPNEIENKPLILIDPGHGGRDSGAKSIKGVLEKHINLSISLKIKERLEALDYEVIMTREEDKDFYGKGFDVNKMKRQDLNTRCQIKRDSNCDLFISIHQNFFTDKSCKGSQVWYSRNEVSKELAHILQENFKKDLENSNREEKAANDAYKILRCYTNIPSVIIECGFITNPEEEKKLLTSEYQDKIAECIVNSIKDYYRIQ